MPGPGPDPDPSTTTLLRTAYNVLSAAIYRGVAQTGASDLRPAHGNAMEMLAIQDGLRLTDIAARAGMAPQSMGELVDDLVLEGIPGAARGPRRPPGQAHLPHRERPRDGRSQQGGDAPGRRGNIAAAGRAAIPADAPRPDRHRRTGSSGHHRLRRSSCQRRHRADAIKIKAKRTQFGTTDLLDALPGHVPRPRHGLMTIFRGGTDGCGGPTGSARIRGSGAAAVSKPVTLRHNLAASGAAAPSVPQGRSRRPGP